MQPDNLQAIDLSFCTAKINVAVINLQKKKKKKEKRIEKQTFVSRICHLSSVCHSIGPSTFFFSFFNIIFFLFLSLYLFWQRLGRYSVCCFSFSVFAFFFFLFLCFFWGGCFVLFFLFVFFLFLFFFCFLFFQTNFLIRFLIFYFTSILYFLFFRYVYYHFFYHSIISFFCIFYLLFLSSTSVSIMPNKLFFS